MPIRIVRLGTARSSGEGLRIGTVRRPPRGVPKAEFANRDFYDVWLPELSPSEELIKAGTAALTDVEWKSFVRRFRAELAKPERARLLDLLGAFALTTAFSVGCYCENESRCHRSVLRELFTERGANVL
ncbi:MAG: DUF488 family protein [Acidobacteria bacterium]|nr:DUF488 family protein [Acidobacteriota bacterium]